MTISEKKFNKKSITRPKGRKTRVRIITNKILCFNFIEKRHDEVIKQTFNEEKIMQI